MMAAWQPVRADGGTDRLEHGRRATRACRARSSAGRRSTPARAAVRGCRRCACGADRGNDFRVPHHLHDSLSHWPGRPRIDQRLGDAHRFGVGQRIVQLMQRVGALADPAPRHRRGVTLAGASAPRRKWPASLPQQPRISRCLRLMCVMRVDLAGAGVGVVAGDDVAAAVARQHQAFLEGARGPGGFDDDVDALAVRERPHAPPGALPATCRSGRARDRRPSRRARSSRAAGAPIAMIVEAPPSRASAIVLKPDGAGALDEDAVAGTEAPRAR